MRRVAVAASLLAIVFGLAPPVVRAASVFTSTISLVTPGELWASWRPGCPVGPDRLRRLTVSHWGFDGAAREGRLIVHADLAGEMVSIMRDLFHRGFAIERMVPVEAYGGSDERSMEANNTSAFNCRTVAGTSTWSRHAFGSAIDINPVQNPFVQGSTVSPPAGRAYLDRSTPAPGKIRAGDGTVAAFTGRGWAWGGNWTSPKDYQHFERSGAPSRPVPAQAGAGTAGAPGRLEVAVRSGTGAVVHHSRTGAGWLPPNSLGGYSDSTPDLATSGSGRIDAVVLGGDGAVWHRARTGGAWSGWASLGGIVRSGPTVVSPFSNRVDVFALGLDRALWTNTWSGSWSGWRSLGGILTSDPDAVSVAPGRIDVFVRGNDNAIWTLPYTAGAWRTWSSIGGISSSGPSGASHAESTVDVFTRGTNGELYGNSFSGAGWSGWYSLGGLTRSDPDAAAGPGGPLTIVVTGLDDTLWTRQWSGSWSGWQPLL